MGGPPLEVQPAPGHRGEVGPAMIQSIFWGEIENRLQNELRLELQVVAYLAEGCCQIAGTEPAR